MNCKILTIFGGDFGKSESPCSTLAFASPAVSINLNRCSELCAGRRFLWLGVDAVVGLDFLNSLNKKKQLESFNLLPIIPEPNYTNFSIIYMQPIDAKVN